MTQLVTAAFVFFAMRRLVSGTRLRAAIVARIGETAYVWTFAAASVLVLAWLAFAYSAARASSADVMLFDPPAAFSTLQLGLQPLALFLIVAGLSTRNPTIVAQGRHARDPAIVRGILRVTRHPFLWGVALFGIGHLSVRGDLASLVLFGTLALVALIGTRSIDAKRRERYGATYLDFERVTSNLPFAAILAGRQRLVPAEIGWLRGLAALATIVAAFMLHAAPFYGAGR